MPIVSVRGLTKSYGGRPPALRDVSLEIGGGVTGLLGPNGAGKSTLLQCVLGLLPDWEGEVEVLGLDARKERREIRRRVGFMPETDAYLPDMSGIRAVRFLGQLTGMPYNDALRRAHEVLYHVGLGEAVYRDIREYSTGMRQRFKLAQALVHDPELVFLDEPLAGLDPSGRDELLGLIRDLAAEHGKYIVWSSHILPEVQKVADAVVVLKDGQCKGTFRLEDLHPREGVYVLEVTGDGTAFRVHLEAEGFELNIAANTPGEDAFADVSRIQVTLPPGHDVRSLFASARASGTRVRHLAPVSEDLEQVFLRLLQEETP